MDASAGLGIQFECDQNLGSDESIILMATFPHCLSVVSLSLAVKMCLSKVAGTSMIHFALALAIMLISACRVERSCSSEESERVVMLEQTKNGQGACPGCDIAPVIFSFLPVLRCF